MALPLSFRYWELSRLSSTDPKKCTNKNSTFFQIYHTLYVLNQTVYHPSRYKPKLFLIRNKIQISFTSKGLYEQVLPREPFASWQILRKREFCFQLLGKYILVSQHGSQNLGHPSVVHLSVNFISNIKQFVNEIALRKEVLKHDLRYFFTLIFARKDSI